MEQGDEYSDGGTETLWQINICRMIDMVEDTQSDDGGWEKSGAGNMVAEAVSWGWI